jgi:hypothetical protein
MSIPENSNLNCPTWCTTDHAGRMDADLKMRIVGHSTTVGSIDLVLGKKANVLVYMCDTEDGRGPVSVIVDLQDEMTAVDARKVAGLLVDAAAVAALPVPPAPVIEWPAVPDSHNFDPNAVIAVRTARDGEVCSCGQPAVWVFCTDVETEGIPVCGGAR